MRRAIVAVEDRRFWSDPGVDLRGIARAVVADVTGGSRQGASTIAQQFVKNALSEQDNRTVFEKLREAALAYHLTRRWSKKKIMEEYLNSIYFGNGAYGSNPPLACTSARCTATTRPPHPGRRARAAATPRGTSCASMLTPPEAALLAGMVAVPSAFDPLAHPQAAYARRKLVLSDMLQLHSISLTEYGRTSERRSRPAPRSSSRRSRPLRRTSRAGCAPRSSPRWARATA